MWAAKWIGCGCDRVRRRHVLACFAALVSMLVIPAAVVAETGTEDSDRARHAAAPPDSAVVELAPLEVIGTTHAGANDPAAVDVDAIALAARDVETTADLAPFLPATCIVVNSRGESQFMVRGASERHVRLWWDGIPLNVPWDERIDATLVPLDAVGAVRGVRGAGSVLEGPNALAGTLELVPARLPRDGRRTRVGAEAGEAGMREGRLMHQMRRGGWELLTAGSWRGADGFLVPEDYAAPSNQGPSRTRLNSDFAQGVLLARLQHRGDSGFVWHATLMGFDGDKAAPPETHLDGDARFWRYPALRRGLAGVGVKTPLGDDGPWLLEADAAVDLFHLEIRDYADATYAGPALDPGVDYETDDDRTLFARTRLSRSAGAGGELALQASTRATRHRESLVVDGPRSTYEQVVSEVAAEARLVPGGGWAVVAGAGWDVASTPASGAQPSRDATGAAAVFLRAERPVSDVVDMHATYARRSRFPSLRELYSGALGRFVPNPGLAPEVQDLWEVGAVARGGAWETGLTGFASLLDGGIEKVGLGDGTNRYERINLDEIRILGLEWVGAWRPHPDWELGAHHAALDARRRFDGTWRRGVEDRPDFVSYATVDWRGPRDTRWTVSAAWLGPRASADPTAPDGLSRLPAQGTVDFRLARGVGGGALFTRGEVHLRVDNVFDALVEAQTGLPQAGRTFSCGFTAWFDAWVGR